MREKASERFSGRVKAERSSSSYQGRRWAKVWRREVVSREMKLRKAGVVIVVLSLVVVCWVVIGSVADDDIAGGWEALDLVGFWK